MSSTTSPKRSMDVIFSNDVEKTSSGLKKPFSQPQKPAQLRSAQDQTTSGSMLMSTLLHKSAQAPRKRDPNATYRCQGCAEEKTPALSLAKERKYAEEKERAYLARNKTVEKSTIKTDIIDKPATDAPPNGATPSTPRINKITTSAASHSYRGSEALKALSNLNINMATAILTVTREVDHKISIIISGFSKKRTFFGADMADRKKIIFGFTGQQHFSDFITKKNNVPIFNKFLPFGRSDDKIELSASAYGRAVDGVLQYLDYKSKKGLRLGVTTSDKFFNTAKMTGLRLSLNGDSTNEKRMSQWGFIMAKSVTQDLRNTSAGTTTSDEDDPTALEVEAAIAAAFEKEMTEIGEVKCDTTSMSPPASTTPLKKKRKASTSTSPSSQRPTKKALHEIMGSLPGAYSASNPMAASTSAPDCDALVNDAANDTKSKNEAKHNLNTNMHVFALHNVPMSDHRELLAKGRVPAWQEQAPIQPAGTQPMVNDFGDAVVPPTAEEILAKAIFDRDTKMQHEAMEREAAQLAEDERKKAAAAIKWKHGSHGNRYRLQGDHVHLVPQGRPLRDARVERNMTQQLADARSGGRQAIWEKEMGFVEEKHEDKPEETKVLKRRAEHTTVKEPKKRLSLAEYKAAKALSKKKQGRASPAPTTERDTECKAPAPGKNTEIEASASVNEAQTGLTRGQATTKQADAGVLTAVEESQSELTAQQEKNIEQAKALALQKEQEDKAVAQEADAKTLAAEEQAKAEAQDADEHAKVDARAQKEQRDSISSIMPKNLKPFDPAAAAWVEWERQQNFRKQLQEQDEGMRRDNERHRQRREEEAKAAEAAEANNAEGTPAPTSTTSNEAPTTAALHQHSAYAGKIPRKGPSGTSTAQPDLSADARPQHNGHATKSPSVVNTAAAATEQTESEADASKPRKCKSDVADVETEPMEASSKKAKITKTTSAKRITAHEDSPEPIAEKREMKQATASAQSSEESPEHTAAEEDTSVHNAPDVDTSGTTISDDDAPLAAASRGIKRKASVPEHSSSESDSQPPPAKRRQRTSSETSQSLRQPTKKVAKKGVANREVEQSGTKYPTLLDNVNGDAAQDAIDEAEFAAVLAKNAAQPKKKKGTAASKSPAVDLTAKDLQNAFEDGTLKAKLNAHSRFEIWNWVKEIGGGIGNGLSRVTKTDLITGIVEGCRIKFRGSSQQPRGARSGGQTHRRRCSPEPPSRASKPDPLHRTQHAGIEKPTRRPTTDRKPSVTNAMSQLKPSYAPGSGPWVRAEEKQARRDATAAGTMFDAAAFKRATTLAVKAYEDEQAENAREWAKDEAKEKVKEQAAARPRQQMPPGAGPRIYYSYRPSPEAGPTAAQREVEAPRARSLSRREAAIEARRRREEGPLDY